jgi:hypothetical protein
MKKFSRHFDGKVLNGQSAFSVEHLQDIYPCRRELTLHD